MEQTLVDDLTTIFQRKLDSGLLDKLIHCLDSAIEAHRDSLFLKTRNDHGEILTFSGVRYFSVVPKHSEAPVIFAGACEPNKVKDRFPAIRFSNNNPFLNSVPLNSKFPYKKPGWMCVVITTKTISILPNLMESEIGKSGANSPKVSLATPNPKVKMSTKKITPQRRPQSSGQGCFLLLLLLGVIFAAIYFPLRSCNSTEVVEHASSPTPVPSLQDTSQIPTTTEQTTTIKKAPPSKSSIEYSFVTQGGKTISASVFPANEYGKGRQIVIFTPFMDYSDGNFYTASLAALHNIFGKHRGLFELVDAEKEYDSIINAKVIYWTISNPTQRLYSFPIIDTDTESIASIVVWIK